MRRSSGLISLNIFFLLFMCDKLASQTPKSIQMAVVNSLYFEDEKTGIKKFVDVKKKVEAEFKPLVDEITGMQKRLGDLKKVIESSSTKYDQSKIDEYEKLNKSITRKGEDYQLQINKRYNSLIGPVNTSIGAAMKQWCKQKGFDMLVDISKDDKGIILWIEEEKINELTLDLIKYCNTVL